MIPLDCRQKGPGPQLGARGPGETGPYGRWPEPDEDQLDGGDQDDEPYPDTAGLREYEPPAAAVARPGEVDQ